QQSPEKSDSPGNCGNSGGVVTVVKPTAVAIVTPQRSNSLDYLNFEEKRQIIASSLSLSDFLHHGPAAAAAAAKGVAATKVIVGRSINVSELCTVFRHQRRQRKRNPVLGFITKRSNLCIFTWLSLFIEAHRQFAVAAVKSLPSEQLLEDILFIDSNFKIVSKSIILLESSKLQLSEALNIVYNVSQTVIKNNNSLISEKVKCKLRNIIAKNSAYLQLHIINDVLSGHDKTSEIDVLKSSDFPFFKYAHITSCDVEHTFSQYKNCLSDHRRRFTLQSLKMYVTLHCTYSRMM
ncbi:hypothetical protein ANN_08234, partial [Periplaneta americana]